MTENADTILAIDLGRLKSVSCAYSRSSRHHVFRTIDSKPDSLAEHPGSLVVIEAYAGGRGCDVMRVASAGPSASANGTAARREEPWRGVKRAAGVAIVLGSDTAVSLGC